MEALGVQFEETEKKAYQTGETYETALIVKASSLSKKLKENRGDLGDLQEEYDSVTTGLARFAQAHEVLGDNASDAKAALDTLNQAYDAAADYAATYGDAVEVTGEQAEAVSKTYPKLADSIAKVGDQYVVCKSSALNAADGLIAANGRISGSAKATAKATLTQLKSIAAGYQEVASLAMAAYSADQSRENYENLKNAFLLSTKAQGAMNRLQNAISDSEKYGYNASTDSASSSGTKKSGKSSSSKSTKDAELERLKDIVSLRKSELTLMQERGDSTADQIAKMRQIQSALHDEAEYLRKIGGSQADINALSTEHWKITKQIQELQKDLWSELEDAVNKKLDEAAEARDKQTAAIDKQIEALKDAKETEDEALKLEELRAAVIEKQNALLEAQSERTVRVFNAATGQWEWEANAATVKSAEDAYEKAKEDLAEYERELALQKEIDELEAKKQLIEDTYDTLKAEWEKITDSLQEPTREIDDILSDLAANGTPKMREQVEAVNDILGKLNDYIAGAINDIQAAGEQAAAAASGSGSGGGYHFDNDKIVVDLRVLLRVLGPQQLRLALRKLPCKGLVAIQNIVLRWVDTQRPGGIVPYPRRQHFRKAKAHIAVAPVVAVNTQRIRCVGQQGRGSVGQILCFPVVVFRENGRHVVHHLPISPVQRQQRRDGRKYVRPGFHLVGALQKAEKCPVQIRPLVHQIVLGGPFCRVHGLHRVFHQKNPLLDVKIRPVTEHQPLVQRNAPPEPDLVDVVIKGPVQIGKRHRGAAPLAVVEVHGDTPVRDKRPGKPACWVIIQCKGRGPVRLQEPQAAQLRKGSSQHFAVIVHPLRVIHVPCTPFTKTAHHPLSGKFLPRSRSLPQPTAASPSAPAAGFRPWCSWQWPRRSECARGLPGGLLKIGRSGL